MISYLYLVTRRAQARGRGCCSFVLAVPPRWRTKNVNSPGTLMKKRKKKRRGAKDEGSYVCPTCGEQIISTGGTEQEYGEDCPVCCNPNLIHVEFFDADEAPRVWAEAE